MPTKEILYHVHHQRIPFFIKLVDIEDHEWTGHLYRCLTRKEIGNLLKTFQQCQTHLLRRDRDRFHGREQVDKHRWLPQQRLWVVPDRLSGNALCRIRCTSGLGEEGFLCPGERLSIE